MAQSEGSELEARLYDYCKRGFTTDTGEFVSISHLAKALKTTADELEPIIERGQARKLLAAEWSKGERFVSFATDAYRAEKAAAAQRANDAIADAFGFEPDGKKTAESGKARGRKPRGRAPKRKSRLAPLGPYAPVPRAIDNVSLAAKGLAFTIAKSINLGPWNSDLHVDMTYPELTARTRASRSTLQRLTRELVTAGYLETENLQRGGVRFRFIGSPVTTT